MRYTLTNSDLSLSKLYAYSAGAHIRHTENVDLPQENVQYSSTASVHT